MTVQEELNSTWINTCINSNQTIGTHLAKLRMHHSRVNHQSHGNILLGGLIHRVDLNRDGEIVVMRWDDSV